MTNEVRGRGVDGRKPRMGTVQVNSVASEEVFRLRNEGRRERIVEQLDHFDEQHDTETGVRSYILRPGTVTMYKPVRTRPDGSVEYSPRTVSVTSIGLLLHNGWAALCPTCGQHHLDKDGQPTSDPNACSAIDPLAVRICPVCGKRLYDNWGTGAADHTGDEDDPNIIPNEGIASTPVERTRVSLNLHMWARHPREAQMRGTEPLPTALRDMVANIKPV